MKKVFLLIALFFTAALAAFSADKPEYNIKIRIKGLKDTMVYMAYYMGEATYMHDSARMDSKGWVEFKRDTVLECGIYLIAVNRVKLFEFVVSEQQFTLETDTANYITNMKVKGSKNNDVFYDWQKYVYSVEVEETSLKETLEKIQGNPAMADSARKISERIKQIPTTVYNYRKELIKNNPGMVLTQMFNFLSDPEIPPTVDSASRFYYYRDHYWDNMDFTSACILRSPVYKGKLMRYFDNLFPQHPDSLWEAADKLVSKTLANKELFRYTLGTIINKYAESKLICMDGVAVRLTYKYYTKDNVFWLDTVETNRQRSNAESFMPTLCNLPAPPLMMYDTTLQRKVNKIVDSDTNEITRGDKLYRLLQKEKTTDLYDVKAEYTILVFWDPDCGHCKKEMPIIKKLYDTVKSMGVQTYAVCVEQDFENFVKYIREHKLDWINVSDIYNMTGFRKSYNLNSTPQIFLLDKNKRIMYKRLSAEQLKEILYHELKLPYTPPAEKPDESHSPDDGHGH